MYFFYLAEKGSKGSRIPGFKCWIPCDTILPHVLNIFVEPYTTEFDLIYQLAVFNGIFTA